mmetsp:Transcript_22518/g.44492  ORF Transcript_22518/g.44492 Transcript_22518/m.44492 type:complete len:434 (-) Transcript_22518:216-1517(-)
MLLPSSLTSSSSSLSSSLSLNTAPAPGRESLNALANQIVKAADDSFGVCDDIGKAALSIVARAWDGTLSESLTQEVIPLETAIATASADLDKAMYSYLGKTVPKLVKSMPSFNGEKIVEDIIKAFGKLKDCKFHEFRTVDIDNMQAVISKTEDEWRVTPRKHAVSTVLDFLCQLLNLSEGLRKRANRFTANDLAHTRATELKDSQAMHDMFPWNSNDLNTPKKQLVYDSRERTCQEILDCYHQEPNFTALFQPPPRSGDDDPENDEEDDENDYDFWLTQKMAARLHFQACVCSDDDELRHGDMPRLPKIARSFWRKSAAWRLDLMECYRRIACRLAQGMPPSPNCTGEEMALHNIITVAPEADEVIGNSDFGERDILSALPTYRNDDNFDLVSDAAFQDHDVLMLFEKGDGGFGNDDEEEDDKRAEPGHMAPS